MASAMPAAASRLPHQIVILRQGTDGQQGHSQLMNNIQACQSVADIVRTTLGPLGMDKLIADMNGNVTISNDGATIMGLLDVSHPAARILVDISRSQDSEIGDGTTSVVILTAELLERAKPFLEKKINPRIIASGYMKAAKIAIDKVNEFALAVPRGEKSEFLNMLKCCAGTAISSKLISHNKQYFSNMAVEAVMSLDPDNLNERDIGIKRVSGGAVQDSLMVNGVAFKKTFSYAGFEQQPKSFNNPKILSLNIELELKAERDNAEIRVTNTKDYQEVVDAEWSLIFDKLEKITKSGANIVLSKLPIGDLAMQFFADRGVFSAGRVPSEDINRVLKAVGGSFLTSVNNILPEHLGTCERFEERQIGAERFNIFEGCPNAKTCTIVLRGGAEQFIAEVERSLHDSIMVVKRALKHNSIVAGGGAIEMRVSKYIRDHARNLDGEDHFVFNSFARALEIIPRQLCDNAGLDTTEIMNILRFKHARGDCWYGVDVDSGNCSNNFEKYIWEPPMVKTNMISAAVEAACIILTTDYTVCNPSKAEPMPSGHPSGGSYPGAGGLPIR